MFNNVALDVVIGLVFIYLLYSLLVTIIQEIIANRLSYRAKFLEKAIIRMLEDEPKDSKTALPVRLGIRINMLSKSEKEANRFSSFFYAHPLIRYLGERPERSKPSYLASESFSKVIIDILRGEKNVPGQEMRSKIQQALDSGIINPVRSVKSTDTKSNNEDSFQIKPQTLSYLNSIWVDAQGDIDRFKDLLENWFNETMDRTTGWYKKYVQFISLILGLVIAIVFNVDTIAIAHKLERDPKLREQIVQQADAYIKAYPDLSGKIDNERKKAITVIDTAGKSKIQIDSILKAPNKTIDSSYFKIKAKEDSLLAKADSLVNKDISKTNEILGLGIGKYQWDECTDRCWILCLIRSLFGWIITALALSLGAPFWFDLLNKLMKLRTSVAPSAPADKQKKTDVAMPKINRVG